MHCGFTGNSLRLLLLFGFQNIYIRKPLNYRLLNTYAKNVSEQLASNLPFCYQRYEGDCKGLLKKEKVSFLGKKLSDKSVKKECA